MGRLRYVPTILFAVLVVSLWGGVDDLMRHPARDAAGRTVVTVLAFLVVLWMAGLLIGTPREERGRSLAKWLVGVLLVSGIVLLVGLSAEGGAWDLALWHGTASFFLGAGLVMQVRLGGGGSLVLEVILLGLRGCFLILVHGLAALPVVGLWLMLVIHIHGSHGMGGMAFLFFWGALRSIAKDLDRIVDRPVPDNVPWVAPPGLVGSLQAGMVGALVTLPIALFVDMVFSLLWCCMGFLLAFSVGIFATSHRSPGERARAPVQFVPSATCYLVRQVSYLCHFIPVVFLIAYVLVVVLVVVASLEPFSPLPGFGIFLALLFIALGMALILLRLGRFGVRSPLRMEVTPAAMHVDDRRGRKAVVFWSNVRKAEEKTSPWAIFDYLELTLDAKIVHLREEGLTPIQWRDLREGVRDRVTEAGGRARISV